MENVPGDYFLDVDDEMLSFLEKQGEECIREIQQSNLLNKENGQKLLSILIVGIGSSFFLLAQKQTENFLSAGIAAFTVYWSFCAAYLVIRVLSVRQRALISSTPHALYHKDYKGFCEEDYVGFKAKGFTGDCTTLNIMRRYRLADLNKMATLARVENSRLGVELERVRIATILTPICALIISAITYLFF